MNQITNILNQSHEKPIRLMTHMVIGFPDLEKSAEVLKALIDSDSSFIELQIPFSDPLADGPVIMNACDEALRNNITFSECLEFISTHPSGNNQAYILVCYVNLIYDYGISRFAEDMQKSGVSGVIVPDLPFDSPEGIELLRCLQENELLWIPIVTQETTKIRLEKMAEVFQEGFSYCTAYSGVTGASGNTIQLSHLDSARDILQLPIAVGFGIRTGKQVRELVGKVDIVVLGSVLIDLIHRDPSNIQRNILDFLGEITDSCMEGSNDFWFEEKIG